jgi:tetratricopeptide (TPR) repeat protein
MEEDEENPFGDKWEYGYPLDSDSNVELELCPFCGEMVETIDGECIDCGNKILTRDEVIEYEDEEEEENNQTLEDLFKEEFREELGPPQEKPRDCYDLGKRLFKDGKPCEEMFKKAIVLDSTFYMAHYYLGKAYFEKGDDAEAEKCFNEVIQLKSDMYMAHYYLGRLHLEKDKLIDAEDNFKKSLLGSPNSSWPHYYLGKTLLKREKLRGAEREFKKALELNSNLGSAKVYLNEIISRISQVEFPMTVQEVEHLTENRILMNHALMEWFETNLRKIIKAILEKEYREEWWLRGVPPKVRQKSEERLVEFPDGEMLSPDLLSYLQFYQYAEIVKNNKSIFNSYLDAKEWIHRLHNLENVRNGIMHSRDSHLTDERNSTLKERCYELEDIRKRVDIF